MNFKRAIGDWTLVGRKWQIPASVPGDITIEFYKAGIVSDPYIQENYKDSEWVGREDFTYQTRFDLTKEELSKPCHELVFESVDLYSEIYLNGELLGKTENAFLEYRFDVSKIVLPKGNVLEVKMSSTLNAMDKFDTTGYFVIFNQARIFLRKPQCHFGWDWAPKICAYGIAGNVYFESKEPYQIADVSYKSDDRGHLSFFFETNYSTKAVVDPDGNVLKPGVPKENDRFLVKLSKSPYKEDYETYEVPSMGKKTFFAVNFENFEKWWPSGYGAQPLYNYVIELYRGERKIDEKKGVFAFRTVSVLEEGKSNGTLGFDFLINGKKIFLKGSNWVPPECFTGTMTDEKYRDMIALARDMNVNILRVWGGGSYEKDIFYDLCDRYGIMVWQDICLACADIPEDDKAFVANLLKEVEFQVKRLRNHPSLIYWCGGNEKTGTYGNLITHGDFLVNCLLYGVIYNLDDSRPYRRQSPHSHTDVGNDWTSGDTHHGSLEPALQRGMKDYRAQVAEKIVPFTSECAVLGPSSEETMAKIFGKDHLWPMDEMWKDRLMDNPYAAVLMDFPHRELYYAESLYGKVEGFSDFIKKGMLAHAEAIRVESDFVRAHRSVCGAFLNWMYDDIWPSGTWAIVDYYLEPKEAYYALRRSYAPHLASFYQDERGFTHFFFDNSTLTPFNGTIKVGARKLDGSLSFEEEITVKDALEKVYDVALKKKDFAPDEYLFATYMENGKETKTLYSPSMWSNLFYENRFHYELQIESKTKAKLIVCADSFVKSLYIHFKENNKYLFSDNYLDMEKGDVREIEIVSKEETDWKSLSLSAF